MGVSSETFYNWRNKLFGLQVRMGARS
ncbi:hypothetical protein [Vibrio gigantis]